MISDSESAYVALLDVLGFRDLVSDNCHADLTELYDRLFCRLPELAITKGRVAFKRGMFRPDMSQARVNFMTVSDSVVFWTEKEGLSELEEIVRVVRIIMDDAFRAGIPLRGAISLGPLSYRSYSLESPVENSVTSLFGRGLVRAYEMGTGQAWSGCAIDPCCVEEIEGELLSLMDNEMVPLVVRADVPYKSGKIKSELVINWMRGLTYYPSEEFIKKCFLQHGKSVCGVPVKEMVANTIEFWRCRCECMS